MWTVCLRLSLRRGYGSIFDPGSGSGSGRGSGRPLLRTHSYRRRRRRWFDLRGRYSSQNDKMSGEEMLKSGHGNPDWGRGRGVDALFSYLTAPIVLFIDPCSLG